MENPQLGKVASLKSKFVEAFLNISAYQIKTESERVEKLLNAIAIYLVQTKASGDLICFLLDGKLFLQQTSQCRLDFSEKCKSLMEGYVEQLKESDERRPHALQIYNHWEAANSELVDLADMSNKVN
jgi:hypothetical protein